jgi:hypothetical protein
MPSELQDRTNLPPLSGKVKAIAALVIGLTLVALVVDRRRERTGSLLVQVDGGNVTITLMHEGRAVVSASNRRSFVLLPGAYEVIADGPGHSWRALPSRVTVPLGGRAVVRVERVVEGSAIPK